MLCCFWFILYIALEEIFVHYHRLYISLLCTLLNSAILTTDKITISSHNHSREKLAQQ